MRKRICATLTVAASLVAVALVAAPAPAAEDVVAATPPASVDPKSATPAPPAQIESPAVFSASCDGGCVWTQQDFNGSKVTFQGSDAGTVITLGSFDRSSKNRFGGNRFMAFYRGNGNLVRCLDKDEQESNLPLSTDFLLIGGLGSQC